MSEAPWKKLVEQLRASDIESPYLDRLRARMPTGSSELAREILREMASALARSEAKVDAALLRVDLEARAIEEIAGAEVRDAAWRREINARIAAFNREREVALHCRWELLVHREALGFRRNDELATDYPVPPERAPVE